MSLELGSLYGVWQMRESCGISGHQPRINQLARDGLDAAIEKVLNLIQETKWPVSTPHSIFVGGICLQQPVPRTESLILLGLISYFQPLPATSSHFQPPGFGPNLDARSRRPPLQAWNRVLPYLLRWDYHPCVPVDSLISSYAAVCLAFFRHWVPTMERGRMDD